MTRRPLSRIEPFPGLIWIAAIGSGLLAGCGAPAAPQPPSLQLPVPVTNLSASRIANSTQLTWTMPTRTTDKVPLQHPVTVVICRAVESGTCTRVGQISVAPGATGTYKDELPSSLDSGPNQLLHYEVSLQNHAGKSAGPSKPAYSASGASPAALTALGGKARPDGVQLDWNAAPMPSTPVTFRIDRTLLSVAAEEQPKKSLLTPPAAAVDQTLVVRATGGVDPGHAIDASAQFNQQYRYVVQRVASFQFGSIAVEVRGAPSDAVEISTADKFPPAVPKGLAAVADTSAGAIDLSWFPDEESDLAAYNVFRRDKANQQVERIATVKLETSFRDSGVQPGHAYAYSLSAVDQTGNESGRSPEVEETLPSQ